MNKTSFHGSFFDQSRNVETVRIYAGKRSRNVETVRTYAGKGPGSFSDQLTFFSRFHIFTPVAVPHESIFTFIYFSILFFILTIFILFNTYFNIFIPF